LPPAQRMERRGYGIPLLPDLAANQSSTPVPYPLSSSMRRQPISQLDQATAKCLFGTHYRRELFLFGYPGQTRYSWQSIWDLKSGHHLLGPLEYRAPVHSAVFTPDGYVLAAAGTSLVSWDATTGRQVAVAENVTPGHAQMVGSDEPTPPELIVDLKITRDGSRIIALYGSKQEYDFDSEIDAYNNGVDIYNFRGRYEATQVGLWSRDLKLIKALNRS
jgi:hypothetical protein